jgi:hypothetical protein
MRGQTFPQNGHSVMAGKCTPLILESASEYSTMPTAALPSPKRGHASRLGTGVLLQITIRPFSDSLY